MNMDINQIRFLIENAIRHLDQDGIENKFVETCFEIKGGLQESLYSKGESKTYLSEDQAEIIGRFVCFKTLNFIIESKIESIKNLNDFYMNFHLHSIEIFNESFHSFLIHRVINHSLVKYKFSYDVGVYILKMQDWAVSSEAIDASMQAHWVLPEHYSNRDRILYQ